MTDEALEKRLTLIEQRLDDMEQTFGHRMDHLEQAMNRGFDRMFTRADFYFGLFMLTCAQTGIFALLLALFDYGGQP